MNDFVELTFGVPKLVWDGLNADDPIPDNEISLLGNGFRTISVWVGRDDLPEILKIIAPQDK